jgi:predicted hotdog family 3-hydroxylacyl-ACP dehydratase
MLADKDTVAKLIPQEPPMVMVHELIGHDKAETITAFTVEEGNIFLEKGLFSEAGLIENMAQSAALRTGWMSAMINESDKEFTPVVGVIGAIKNFELLRLPEMNSRLITTIELLTEFGSATMIKAFVRKEEELLASAELKIFLSENREAETI